MWCFFRFPPLWPGVPVTLPIAGGQRTWVASESRTGAPGVGQGSRGFPETWRTTQKASFDWTKWSNDAHKTSIKIWLTLWSWPWCACAYVPLFSKTMGCARLVAPLRSCLRRRMMELATSQRSTAWASWRTATLGCAFDDTWWGWDMFHQDPSDVKCYYIILQ